MDFDAGLEIRGAGGGGCFPGHVHVTTPTGSTPISQLQVGDTVIAFDDQGALHAAPITAVHIHDNHPVTRYRLWGGMVLDATDNHWVLNQFNSFVAIGTLGSDDCLVDARNHLRPIISKEPLEPTTVFNLTVEGFHTFIADGIRVHNAGLGADIQGAGGGGGGKGGGGSSRTPVEAANNLFSVAFAKTLFAVSEGEIEGFPNSAAKDIYLDGTAIQRKDGTYNWKDVTLEYKSGTDAQEPIKGFTQAENTVNVSTQVSKDVGPISRTITDSDVEKVRVIIQHPSLQSINADTGDTNPTSVSYKISLSSNGGAFVTKAEPTISGKSSGQFQRAYEFDLTGSAPWDIKVERVTADSTNSLLSNSIVWQAYTEIIDEKLCYPNTALLGVRVDARQFSNIPDVTVRLRGRRVQVPNNYNPTNRTYTGTWDGTWKTAWTDNPAWIFRDLVVNPVFGVRRYLSSADVDKWSLYEISRYCDELVPNGKGGTEPRYRCNVYLQNSGSVFEVLNGLASVFRGLIYNDGGTIHVTQDRAGTPVQQFSEANVIQEVDESGRVTSPCFSYSGSSRTARKSVVLVNWDDPDQNYNSVVEYLQDDELLRKFGYNPIDLRLIGVTSRSQAVRAAKDALFANRYLTEKVSFRVAAEGLASSVGEIIQICDPGKQGQRIAGRITEVDGSTITTDAPLNLQTGTSYTITLVVPDGETTTHGDGTTTTRPALREYTVTSWKADTYSETGTLGADSVTDLIAQDGKSLVASRQVFNTVGTQDSSILTTQDGVVLGIETFGTTNTVLTLNSTVTAPVGSLWVLEWTDMNASLYRILSISETEPLTYLIEALQYNNSKYSYVDNDDPITIPKDRYLVRDVNPPTDLKAELDYRNGRVRIFANWVAPQLNGVDDAQVSEYRYQYRQKGSEQWTVATDTLYTEADVSLSQYTSGTELQFRVASRNRLGQQSSWVQVDVSAMKALPDISSSAYGASVGHVNQPDGTQLIIVNRGTMPLPERVKGYRIWAKPGNDLVGTLPGTLKAESDGYYLLSDISTAGYYTIAFHRPATYTIRVGLVSAVAGETASTYIYDTVNKDEIQPPTPTNFTVIQTTDNKKRFSWSVPKSSYGAWDKGIVSDITHFDVRYKQGNLSDTTLAKAWDIGIELYSSGVSSTQQWFETSLFDDGAWLVMIKAVDKTKWESDTAAYILVNTQSALAANVVVTGTANLSAGSTILTNAALSSVYEVQSEGGTSLLTESGTPLDQDQSGANYVRQTDIGEDAFVFWVFDNNDLESRLTLTTSASATFEHRIRSLAGLEIPVLLENDNTLTLESGTELSLESYDYSSVASTDLASTIWHPYAQGERLTADTYAVRTRIRSANSTTLAELYSVTYTLDYADITETFNDVATNGTTDTTITLTKAFHAVTGVQATLQANGGSAITVLIVSRSTTQVVLRTLNSAGNRTAGLVDLTVQGY